ncbi:receptor-like protein 12 [Phtheirospermum japonicum]|uniref:Receptor-like protein 12 n=1 Tax=Phtheirospermum japonicum TaxID=374723 RepID=A0A830CP93_9LAMI|nr:receptor-like protein 12 [Phtheirospermum japonicum]
MVQYEFVVVGNNNGEVRCIEREREALLTFKKGLTEDNDLLSSWGSEDDKKECCEWFYVGCSNTTGHVIELIVSGDRGSDGSDYYLRGKIRSALVELHHLRVLDLSGNDFGGNRIPEFIFSMTQLQDLNLDNANLSGIVPPQLGNLTNLKTLVLSRNYMYSDNLNWLSHLSLLSRRNKLLKRLPLSIWQLSLLEELDVSYNSLEGTITESNFTKLHNLQVLILSFNSLTLDIKPDWTPPFQLSFISLAGCNMGPRFPLWLQTQSYFSWLDISSNGISGEVPDWLWSLDFTLESLNISHNQFTGTFPYLSSRMYGGWVDFSYNKFSGPIPLFSPVTSILRLSHNMFTGSISFLCESQNDDLGLLDLSDNQLEGELPNCWENMTQLYFLNLANNSFSGEIPNALGSLSDLRTLHLSNNNLSGELPPTLKNCKSLYLIDIGGNKLTGHVPAWIGAYHETMMYLSFRDNRFDGIIPPQICNLTRVQVLDLSGNNLSGKIPQCFNNFASMVDKGTTSTNIIGLDFRYKVYYVLYYTEYALVQWKGKELEYRRTLQFLKLIDLSSNGLVGNIPGSFSSLKGLNSLNLSRNCFTGTINSDIGQMEMLEVLDLSSNQLSGAIPVSMARLSFLDVLDLTNNNLTGKIPVGNQLQTFTASSYAGNIGLCGSPLLLCPGDSPDPSTNNEKDGDGILSLSFLKEFGVSIILGFTLGFWGVVGSLTLKEYWRREFFNFWGAVGDWLYVTTAIFWTKFIRS